MTDFFLRAGYRGLGLGSSAFRALEQLAIGWGLRALELQAERDNPEALAFYAKLGFRRHDRIPMSKRLTANPAATHRGGIAGEPVV